MLLTRKERGHERQIKVAKCPINRIKLLDIQMNLIKLAQKQKIDGMNRVEFVKYCCALVKSLLNLLSEEETLNGIPDC